MAQRLIRILKPIHFQGSKFSGGVDVYLDPPLAEEICSEVALALSICNDMLGAQGSAPLGLIVEGHTSASFASQSDAQRQESVRISTLRALQCERSILRALRVQHPQQRTLWSAELERIVNHRGLGSAHPLPGYDDGENYSENRRVEMRLVEPGAEDYMQPKPPEPARPPPPSVVSKPTFKSAKSSAGATKLVERRRFKLSNDPDMSVVDQLREQIRTKGLRVRELFTELDEGEDDLADGAITLGDWMHGMRRFGNEVPEAALLAAFRECDLSGDGEIQYMELESLLKGRKPTPTAAPTKRDLALQASRAPPKAVMPRMPGAGSRTALGRAMAAPEPTGSRGGGKPRQASTKRRGLVPQRLDRFAGLSLDRFNPLSRVAKAVDGAASSAVNAIENVTGLDLDRDGDVGEYDSSDDEDLEKGRRGARARR